MPQLSRRLSNSARKAASAFRVRVNSLGRSLSWKSSSKRSRSSRPGGISSQSSVSSHSFHSHPSPPLTPFFLTSNRVSTSPSPTSSRTLTNDSGTDNRSRDRTSDQPHDSGTADVLDDTVLPAAPRLAPDQLDALLVGTGFDGVHKDGNDTSISHDATVKPEPIEDNRSNYIFPSFSTALESSTFLAPAPPSTINHGQHILSACNLSLDADPPSSQLPSMVVAGIAPSHSEHHSPRIGKRSLTDPTLIVPCSSEPSVSDPCAVGSRQFNLSNDMFIDDSVSIVTALDLACDPSNILLPPTATVKLPYSDPSSVTIPRSRRVSVDVLDQMFSFHHDSPNTSDRPEYIIPSHSSNAINNEVERVYMRTPIAQPKCPVIVNPEDNDLRSDHASPIPSLMRRTNTDDSLPSNYSRRSQGLDTSHRHFQYNRLVEYYETRLATLANQYFDELSRLQRERDSLANQLIQLEEQLASVPNFTAETSISTPKEVILADTSVLSSEMSISSADSQSIASNATESTIKGKVRNKRVSFRTSDLLAEAQAGRTRAETALRNVQVELAEVLHERRHSAPVIASRPSPMQNRLILPVTPREWHEVRRTVNEIEILVHALLSRVSRWDQARSRSEYVPRRRSTNLTEDLNLERITFVDENTMETSPKQPRGEMETRLSELLIHVVQGTEQVVYEASSLFEWAAAEGHPTATPEELEAFFSDRDVILRVISSCNPLISILREHPYTEQLFPSPLLNRINDSAPIETSKLQQTKDLEWPSNVGTIVLMLAQSAVIQLTGWVQVIVEAVHDIAESIEVVSGPFNERGNDSHRLRGL